MSQHIVRLAAVAALLGLAGCVGEPGAYAPGPGYGPGYARGPYGGTCFAGNYTCALPQPAPVGAQCSCPGLGAPSYGQVQ